MNDTLADANMVVYENALTALLSTVFHHINPPPSPIPILDKSFVIGAYANQT